MTPAQGNSEENPNNLKNEILGSDKNCGNIKGVEIIKKIKTGKNDFNISSSLTLLNFQRKANANKNDKLIGKMIAGLVPIISKIAAQIMN